MSVALSATPPFAGARARVCAAAGCATILSAYNPDQLCSVCASRAADSEARADERLDFAVLAVLADAYADDPDAVVDVLTMLRARGYEVDCWTLGQAVQRIRRRFGIVARGTRGRPGYRIVRAEAHYKPVVGFGGVLMERDPETGHYVVASALHGPQQLGATRAGQLAMFEPAEADL